MSRIVTDLSNAAYHADTSAVSHSRLSRLARNPSTFMAPMKQTPSMRWGTLVHAITLEAGTFAEHHAVMPEGLDKGKGAKERVSAFEAANAGKEVLDADEYRQLLDVRAAIYADAELGMLLSGPGKTEHSLFWTDEDTGIQCRCRPDYWRDDGIIVDLKSTASSEHHEFQRSAISYHYYSQAAFYYDGVTAVTGKAPNAFVFGAIEGKETPCIYIHGYAVEEEELAFGRRLYKSWLRDLKAYRELSDDCSKWPTKAPALRGIMRLGLPGWAKNEYGIK